MSKPLLQNPIFLEAFQINNNRLSFVYANMPTQKILPIMPVLLVRGQKTTAHPDELTQIEKIGYTTYGQVLNRLNQEQSDIPDYPENDNVEKFLVQKSIDAHQNKHITYLLPIQDIQRHPLGGMLFTKTRMADGTKLTQFIGTVGMMKFKLLKHKAIPLDKAPLYPFKTDEKPIIPDTSFTFSNYRFVPIVPNLTNAVKLARIRYACQHQPE